jgi:hypothetical protein
MSLINSAVTYTTTTTTSDGGAGALVAILPIILLVAVVFVIAGWKLFVKAGKPGWGILVPFYNAYLYAEIGGKPGWWGLVALLVNVIPFVGWIVSVIMSVMIALGVGRNFGKSDVWSVILLWLLPFGYLVLGYGRAQYVGTGQLYNGFDLPPAPGAAAPASDQPAAPVATPEQTPTDAAEEVPQATPTPTEEPQTPAEQPPADDQNPPQSGPNPS